MKKRLIFGGLFFAGFITSCVSPTHPKLSKADIETNSVNQYLKGKKFEFFSLNPTETFTFGGESGQLLLNDWCLTKGGTPYYHFTDRFGDWVQKKLVYYENGKAHAQYASDLYLHPNWYVECKLPNGRTLYAYKEYPISKACQHILNSSCWYVLGLIVKHAPEKEDYYWRYDPKPDSLKNVISYMKCNGNYCWGKIYGNNNVIGLYNIPVLAPYIYCKYHLNGEFYKGSQKFENWWKDFVVNGKGEDWWSASKEDFPGIYYCYDGQKSFKLKLTFAYFSPQTMPKPVYKALLKIDPSLANRKPFQPVSTENQNTDANRIQSARKETIQTPTALSSFRNIALYVAKTKQPFQAQAGGVLVMATPVEVSGDCTLVKIQKYVNGPLYRDETLKVCGNKVVKEENTHPTNAPMPQGISGRLTSVIPNCQAYGKASVNFLGYTIECKALDSEHCNLQITTKARDKVLQVQTVNVCQK